MPEDKLLSILIPTVTDRTEMLMKLVDKIDRQIENKPVELIVMLDNRSLPLGQKRNTMMELAQGKHLAHLDDDDDISEDYVDTILQRLKMFPEVDVLTFNSQSDLGDKMPFVVHAGLHNETEQTNVKKKELPDGTEIEYRPPIKRPPWHWCVWKTALARQGHFPDKFMGEDWAWIQQVMPLCKTDTHIDQVLHYYFYRENVSYSAPGSSEEDSTTETQPDEENS